MRNNLIKLKSESIKYAMSHVFPFIEINTSQNGIFLHDSHESHLLSIYNNNKSNFNTLIVYESNDVGRIFT